MKTKIYLILLLMTANVYAQNAPDFMHFREMQKDEFFEPYDYMTTKDTQWFPRMMHDLPDEPLIPEHNMTMNDFGRNALLSNTRRSEDEKKQRLDSLVASNYLSEKVYKRSFEYDDNNNITLDKYYQWDAAAGQWTNSFKEEYTYDSNGNQTMWVKYKWDAATGQWVNLSKKEYTYDASGNRIMKAYYLWDAATGQWVGNWKYEYTYDSNGNITTNTGYTWDTATGQWVSDRKWEYTYDSNGNVMTSTGYTWDAGTGQWVNDRKWENTYDSNDNITTSAGYIWDAATGQWVNSAKTEYTYDSNDNLTIWAYNLWDTATGQWVNSLKTEFTYDSNQNLTMRADYKWDAAAGQWVRDRKDELTYDSNGNETMRAYYLWDTAAVQWVGIWKVENAFDTTMLSSELITIYSNYPNKITESVEYSWDKDKSEWVKPSTTIYHYSSLVITALSEELDQKALLYPNPVRQDVTIALKDAAAGNEYKILLYDQTGRQWFVKSRLSGDNTLLVSVRDVPPGVYLLRLDGARESEIFKLIIRK